MPQTPSSLPAAHALDDVTSRKIHAHDRRLALIVKKMSADLGIRIECDSTVADLLAPPPAEATTPANFEKQIDTLVSHLPKGTTWAKLSMPDSPKVSAYQPDDLASFAISEARLFGTVGAALPKGTIEVLGQKLAADQAATVGSALKLKPIYIITNPFASHSSPEVQILVPFRASADAPIIFQIMAPDSDPALEIPSAQ